MSKILLLFLLSGPIENPNDWEFKLLDICPTWLRYQLYDDAVEMGLVWDYLTGGMETYWGDAGCFPEWLVKMRARRNSTPLRKDDMFGEWITRKRWEREQSP